MSNRPRVYRTHALILRRHDYRDADRIVRVFTPGMGKLELIAKGVRKLSSRKAGHLELFTHANLLIAQGRTWDVITEAETVEGFHSLRLSLEQISRAGYLCELIDAFSESDDESAAVWDLLLLGLRALDGDGEVAANDPNVLLRWFELQLLSLSGFQPEFFTCIECGEEVKPVVNYLSITEGGVVCPQCRQAHPEAEAVEPDVLKVLRYLQSRPWDAVRGLTVRDMIMRRIDNILYRYLLTVLERHLKSADFLRRVQALPAPAASVPAAVAPAE
jgi:DNA repair protein RecO (recombination protein O)